MFKSGEITHIQSTTTPLRMLITNTKVGRNTKALVSGVSDRASQHPGTMQSVFTAIDFISKELAATIEAPAISDISITAKEEKIAELMEMNQGLLQCLGVSHDSIENVLRTTTKYKLASKLTGAGGGGCLDFAADTNIQHSCREGCCRARIIWIPMFASSSGWQWPANLFQLIDG